MPQHQNGLAHPIHRVVLKRRDILTFETRLLDIFHALITFKNHSISFPRDKKSRSPKWIPEEEKMLLPLPDEKGQTLCVFTASCVNGNNASSVIENWAGISRLIVNNLLLYKQSVCDPVTGLASRHTLLHAVSQDISRLRAPFGTGDGPATPLRSAEPAIQGCFAVFAIRFNTLRDVVKEYGHQFADTLMTALADALQSCCPDQSLPARTGDMEFAVYLPAAGHKMCRQLASTISAALQEVHVLHPLCNEEIGAQPCIGYVLYPQDMAGNAFLQEEQEQAHILLRKARLAAAFAGESHGMDPNCVLPFSRILAEGGRILEMLPLSRVIVSLGNNMHAKEGLRFSVWSPQHAGQAERQAPPLYKGELVLMEVRENTSQAEILHLGDPSWSMAPGDCLVLLEDDRRGYPHRQGKEQQYDPETGLLRHGDFMAAWAEEREKYAVFCLSLVRLAPQSGLEHALPQVAALCRETFGLGTIGGRYGLTSLIFHHGGLEPGETARLFQTLSQKLEETFQLTLAVGIASHPFLDYRKADALENCVKALDYADLLPSPHIGILDSLALNIAADKLYSQGDMFGAVKEYKMAIMADETNSMAWNSLGICLAGLGKHAEAEACFRSVLEYAPHDVMALYNLGYMHQSQGYAEAARECYTKCLAINSGHLFSFIRLGQLAEADNDTGSARGLYKQAAELPGGKGLTYRYFARLCIKENDPDSAREYLHDALIHDPQDAFAMQLMAKMFLDAGEDPDLAASFARQSVSLHPQLKGSWLELARALEIMGMYNQAKEARLRAGEL